MNRAAELLRGTVRVRVEGAFPERVLNLCGAHSVAFSDLRWESANALSFMIRAADRKRLAHILEPLEAEITVERTEGAPFFLRRFRRRYALLAGLALVLLLFAANLLFIWDLEVTGNENVPAEKILRVLGEQGLRRFRLRGRKPCCGITQRAPPCESARRWKRWGRGCSRTIFSVRSTAR